MSGGQVRTRVLILQEVVPAYRVPVMDRLGREYDLTVAHSEEAPPFRATDFRPHPVREPQVFGFHVQRGVQALAREFDVVIAMFDLRWLSSLALWLRGRTPLLWWGHGFGRGRYARAVRALLARRSEGLILYDEAPRAEFVARGVAPEKIFVAPNTIHVPEPELNLDAAARRSFVFVGRLQERKRIGLLFEAFALALPTLPEHVGIEIVGVGAPETALRDEARSLGIADRVRFHGEIRDETVLRDIFHHALAYVSPGHVGLGVLHAFAYGVPVLTRRGPGHAPEVSNIEHGETGLLLDETPAAFARSLSELARNPDEAQRLGANAHARYVEGRTLEHMVAGFQQAIAKVLGDRDRPTRATDLGLPPKRPRP